MNYCKHLRDEQIHDNVNDIIFYALIEYVIFAFFFFKVLDRINDIYKLKNVKDIHSMQEAGCWLNIVVVLRSR